MFGIWSSVNKSNFYFASFHLHGVYHRNIYFFFYFFLFTFRFIFRLFIAFVFITYSVYFFFVPIIFFVEMYVFCFGLRNKYIIVEGKWNEKMGYEKIAKIVFGFI